MAMKTQRTHSLFATGPGPRQFAALTIIEALATILACVILAALLLPSTIGHSEYSGPTCLNNLRQLQLAWGMYADDNQDKLVPNVASNIGGGHYATTPNQDGSRRGQPYASWVLGDASQSDPGFITNGLIFPYLGNIRIYKCPLVAKTNSLHKPPHRSYSMNAWMNGNPAWSSNCVNFTNRAAINNSLSPSMALVFVEENPATINDGYWVQDPISTTRWMDSPAHYHLMGGGLSFADGHAQIRKWTDKYVLDNRPFQFPSDLSSGNLAWIQARCTVKAR